MGEQRFATVAIVGQPNVGKSSLLNALIGEKLAIVSHKPQATREPVIGILTAGDTQLMFVDEPGLLDPAYLLQQAMRQAAISWVRRCDLVLYLHPLGETEPPALESLIPEHGPIRQPTALVLTKTDRVSETNPHYTPDNDIAVFHVSARQRSGLDSLVGWCRANAPIGSFRYDPEHLSSQPERFFVTEFLREAAFANLEQELPYAVAAEVDEFREGEEPIYIRATIYVERTSQQSMVIGRQGRTIKAIGSDARRRIEELLGRQVYLDLWVKTMMKWRSKPHAVARFGFAEQIGDRK